MTVPIATEVWDEAPSPIARSVLVLPMPGRARAWRILLVCCAVAAAIPMVLGLGIAIGFWDDAFLRWPSAPRAVGRMTLPAPVAESPIIYDTAVMPLGREEASAINAKRPLDVENIVPAKALRIARESATGLGYDAAVRCLAQAVYYEAAVERDEGQRAVAQVVLNRVRHAAFPNTICGVVYQGSERVTGCQFSFTCDGSLARIPSAAGWARAERVARDALSGRVAAAVGNATHYHANYVVPYWAPTLDKAATIGTHIFYVMRGFLGSPRAFRREYAVSLEASPETVLAAPEALATDQGLFAPPNALPTFGPGLSAPAEDLRAGRLIPGGPLPALERNAPPELRADESRGELTAGEGARLKVDEPRASPSAEASAVDASK